MPRPVRLVTGVPGWLGTRFVQVLVNGFGGEGPVQPSRTIRCLVMDHADVKPLNDVSSEIEVVKGDLRSPESLAAAVEGVETIFHLAGVVHAKRLADFYAINTQGTRNLLAAAAAASVRRVIYVSSNSVAGYRRQGALMRESDPPRPYLAYGKSKHLAECAIREAAQQHKLETLILRPCWYYGPGQPERQTRFFRMIKRGRPIVFGNGDNLRSLSYLDNVIEALLLAAQAPQASGQVYWIADARPYRTIGIYRTVAELLNVKRFRPIHLPGPASEMCMAADWCLQRLGCYQQELHVGGEMNKDIACSIELATRELGYRPRVELREGMRRSIDWCRSAGIAL